VGKIAIFILCVGWALGFGSSLTTQASPLSTLAELEQSAVRRFLMNETAEGLALKRMLARETAGEATDIALRSELESRLRLREQSLLQAEAAEALPSLLKPRLPRRQRLFDFMDRVKTCKASMPAETAHQKGMRYLFRQLAIDEGLTVTGLGGGALVSLISTGEAQVDWADLPSDLAFEAMDSWSATRYSAATGTVMVRWFKVAGFGMGSSALDATLYYLSPSKEERHGTAEQASLERLGYNLEWEIGMGAPQIALYELTTGLECLYPDSAAVVWFQGLSSAGVHGTYFGLRYLATQPKKTR
jgi:hypothetical protein